MWDSYLNGVRSSDVGFLNFNGVSHPCQLWDSYFNGVRCGIQFLTVSDVGFVF